PVPLAAVSILLILLQLALQNLRSNLQLSVDTMELFVKRGDGGCDEPKEEEKRNSSRGRKELAGMGLVSLFVAMILLLGMFPAVFLYIFGYFALIGRQGWLNALALSGTATIVTYLLFSSLLGVSAYEGWLGSLM
ncbi:MAG: tripartite tricarboxylate transporter TctB family protein, partial [Chloroflexota bacterium]